MEQDAGTLDSLVIVIKLHAVPKLLMSSVFVVLALYLTAIFGIDYNLLSLKTINCFIKRLEPG